MFHVKHTYILCIYMMIFITITNMHTKSMAAQDLKNLFNHMYGRINPALHNYDGLHILQPAYDPILLFCGRYWTYDSSRSFH